MKEKIEAKLETHVRCILKKPVIDYSDFQTLMAYLSKIKADEQEKKWEEEKNARAEEMIKTLTSLVK